MKHWDFVVGNPPYMETTANTSDKPVYNDFMDAAYTVGEKVELITPARFLFNAGKTPKAWNEKMLADEHFKVLSFEQKSETVFPNTAINGGVAITYRDKRKTFGAIGVFTAYDELNHIIGKVKERSHGWLSDIAYSPESYGFTEKFHEEVPYAKDRLSKGHSNDITTNAFDKLPKVFLKNVPDDGEAYIRILGRADNQRVFRYVRKDYISGGQNFDKYKVFIPKSDGAAGTIGNPIPARISGTPIIASKGDCHTQTFMSIGAFNTQTEAKYLFSYMKTKFARCLLGVLKVTQHNPPEKWSYIPMQDFTPSSDIDWKATVPNIDRQLYKKYSLTKEEIEFIETYVKEME